MGFSGKGEKGTLDESAWVQTLAPALTSYRLFTVSIARPSLGCWESRRDRAGRSKVCHPSPESLSLSPPRFTPAALMAARLVSRSEVVLFPVPSSPAVLQ